MPVPSLTKRLYEEGREEGRGEGREQLLAAILRQRFGPDNRINRIARQLATADLDTASKRLGEASSLDDLADD